MKKFARPVLIAAGFSALALVAGCHSKPDEAPLENTEVNLVETNVIDTNIAEPVATPTVAPVTNVTSSSRNPNADLTKDDETLDDAAATGDTAKLPSDDATQPAKNP